MYNSFEYSDKCLTMQLSQNRKPWKSHLCVTSNQAKLFQRSRDKAIKMQNSFIQSCMLWKRDAKSAMNTTAASRKSPHETHYRDIKRRKIYLQMSAQRYNQDNKINVTVQLWTLRPNSITLSWSQTGPKLVADLQLAGIWHISSSSLAAT